MKKKVGQLNTLLISDLTADTRKATPTRSDNPHRMVSESIISA